MHICLISDSVFPYFRIAFIHFMVSFLTRIVEDSFLDDASYLCICIRHRLAPFLTTGFFPISSLPLPISLLPPPLILSTKTPPSHLQPSSLSQRAGNVRGLCFAVRTAAPHTWLLAKRRGVGGGARLRRRTALSERQPTASVISLIYAVARPRLCMLLMFCFYDVCYFRIVVVN